MPYLRGETLHDETRGDVCIPTREVLIKIVSDGLHGSNSNKMGEAPGDRARDLVMWLVPANPRGETTLKPLPNPPLATTRAARRSWRLSKA